MPHRKPALFACLALLSGVLSGSEPGNLRPDPLPMAPCRPEHPQGLVAMEAECGLLTVAEDPGVAGGRTLQLAVTRLPALSRQRAQQPLFVIAGGPGLGSRTFYMSVSPAFARIRRTRDIVLVDQRGTGGSRPLDCPFAEQRLWDAEETEINRVMAACRARLQREHDLAQYTTSVAVQDLDAVRRALGYQRIALYGSSYGTRVAQHYARRFADHTYALLLDGVVPPQRALGPTTPLDAEQALLQILARCREDRACATRFGDPEGDYRALRVRLAAAPVAVTVDDPRSGRPHALQFSAAMLAGALRLATYSGEQAALLPLALHLAADEQQYGPLASQYLLAAADYGAVLAFGMHNSVVCTEDVPFFDAAGIDRSQLDATYLGNSQLDALRALCAEWPRGRIDADLHAPLSSSVPALLLSGGADPVTPPAFGAQAALGFSRALHLTLPGQGHGQLLQPCMDGIMAQFLDRSSETGVPRVDTVCLAKIRPAPFFLSLNGPAP